MFAIEQVVGAHDGRRIRFVHNDAETLQIDIPKCPLADNRVRMHTVSFLIVGAEVLDGHATAGMLLDTLGNGCSHFSANQGVF